MGPTKYRGMGGGGGAKSGATPPTSPQNGSGGGGIIPIGASNFAPAVSEISDITTGRITLSMVNFTILALLGFYWVTRGSQGGS